MLRITPLSLNLCFRVGITKPYAERNQLVLLQGPPHDFEAPTSNEGVQPMFQSISDQLFHLHDEEMVRLAMEAAVSQYDSVGDSEFYNQISQDVPALGNSTNAFYDSLPRDNQLCRVLS